jgi:hypothetical protein
VKLPAHRARLPGNEISFLIVPLDPAYKAWLAGHVPAKPVDNSTTRTIKLPHLNFELWHLFILIFVTFLARESNYMLFSEETPGTNPLTPRKRRAIIVSKRGGFGESMDFTKGEP